MHIVDEIILHYHEDCLHGHFTLGAMRKCAGRFVHIDEVKTVTYVRKPEEGKI